MGVFNLFNRVFNNSLLIMAVFGFNNLPFVYFDIDRDIIFPKDIIDRKEPFEI